MWLLIDDTRNLLTDAVARTPRAARKLLSVGGWECVCFDNDLQSNETGLDILVWAIQNNLLPNHIQIVTSISLARQQMGQALENSGYSTADGFNYYQTPPTSS